MNSLRLLCVVALSGGVGLVGCGGGKDPVDAGPDAGSQPDYTTGVACADDSDCGSNGSGQCLIGFEKYSEAPPPTSNDPSPIGGLSYPGGYCSNAVTCETDADCGADGACFRPLDGATDTSELHSLTISDLGALGVCLKPCTASSECREAEGYRCQVPMQYDLRTVSDRSTDTYCIQDETPPCQIDAGAVPAGKCHLEYELFGRFQITDTLAGQGDETVVIGPGTLILEMDRDAAMDSPSQADGAANLLCYSMNQEMVVAGVVTSVDALATGTPAAVGAFSGDTIDMQVDCAYAATYGIDKNMWSPDATTATGTSCVASYRSTGDVVCGLGFACGAGGLVDGHNLQNDMWTQPFNDIVFTNGAGDFTAIEMMGQGNPDRWSPLAVCNTLGLEQPDSGGPYNVQCADSGTWADAGGTLLDIAGTDTPEEACYRNYCALPADKVEIPNGNPSRTFLNFTGTRVNMVCTAP